jgi:hypothetical protein
MLEVNQSAAREQSKVAALKSSNLPIHIHVRLRIPLLSNYALIIEQEDVVDQSIKQTMEARR